MSLQDLLLLIHVDPSVVPCYRTALSALSSNWEIRPIFAGAFSSAYVQLASSLRSPGGHLLEPLLSYCGASPCESYRRIVAVSFSAGYALVREILSGPDARQLAGWIALDSGHAALTTERMPLDVHMDPFVRLARRALAGEALLWFGHSDVKTPQQGPGAFASTTQFGLELLRLLKAEPTEQPTRFVSPLLVVKGHDLRQDDRAEHIAALREWGPAFTTSALAALDGVAPLEVARGTAQIEGGDGPIL
ncbi:hypothetical protein [Chondromyces crocatus]|uniref:Uncharacterized protein n=1 Tax=Chondromyces crocatus TaxID=52 RepID=A0A0K1EAX5_CHOCO|nr:hypothetical protein [Chondromyces crocatus]AKT38004.1 uncharacterized protein CMC5_021450 [Chondromyces crocatus]